MQKKLLFLSTVVCVVLASPVYSQSIARHSHSVTLLPDGNLLIVGGVNSAGNAINSVELFIATAARYETRSSTNFTTRSSHTATLLLDGTVLVAGGTNAGAALGTAFIYNPRTNTWSNSIAMTAARHSHTAVLLKNGRVLMAGGVNNSGSLSSCEIFTPGSPGSFSGTGSMGDARTAHTSTLLKTGMVFASGGYNQTGFVATTEIYSPSTGVWTPGPALIQKRAFHTATGMNNGNVLIAGGYNARDIKGSIGYLETAEIYNPMSNSIVPAESMFMRTSRHTSMLKPNGEVEIGAGLGNITTTYISGSSPKLEPGSILYLSSAANFTALINSNSLVRFPLPIKLSVRVTGIFKDASLYLNNTLASGGPNINLTDMPVYFVGRSTVSLNGYVADEGDVKELLGDTHDPVIQFQAPMGTLYFAPRTGISPAGEPFASAGSVIADKDPISSNTTTNIISDSFFTSSIKIPFSKSAIGATIIEGSARITTGNMESSSFKVSLSSGTGPITGGQIYADDSGNGQLSISVTFNGLAGTITNSTATPIASTQSLAGLKITSLALTLRYVLNQLDIAGQNYSFAGGTLPVREMLFTDTLSYNPAKNEWSFEEPGSDAKFNHTGVLMPNSDSLSFGGRTCSFAGGTPPPYYNCNILIPLGFSGGYVPVYEKDGKASDKPWTKDGDLNTTRGFHTSTLLPSGKILTAGGVSDGQENLNSTEIYDPISGKWTYTGSMSVTRSIHTATLLINGNVLVAGGYTLSGSSGATSSAEIYYPDSGAWVPTSPLKKARQDHTATTLPDGSVMAAGGYANGAYLNSSEIYYPLSAAWVEKANLTINRAQHTATLLKNGKVLIAGGIRHISAGLDVLKSAEIYDPAANTWTNAADMNIARHSHSATLLMDGRVLVAGGDNGFGEIAESEIYDPGTNVWTETVNLPLDIGAGNNMPHARLKHTATLLPDGRVLAVGGVIAGTAIDNCDGFDMVANMWWSNQYGRLNDPRGYHTTVLLRDGYLLAIGGYNGSNYLASTERIYYSPGFPDAAGLNPKNRRPSGLSIASNIFNRGDTVTVLSTAANFHGITEASGGGAGSQNSSFYHPRIYMQSIDNPSGFMLDMSDRIYGNGMNTDWTKMASSITITMPSTAGTLPYGWYHLRAAANAQFAEGYTVQISTPRPSGKPANISGTVLSTGSIAWTWEQGTLQNYNGYALFSSSGNIFIGTSTVTSYLQTNMIPNTAISIAIGGFNLGGTGELARSATYYTYAAAPAALTITSASFISASLMWNSSGNSNHTAYEVSMSLTSDFSADVSIPVPFNSLLTSTSASISNLEPNITYYFRVRAVNGAGITTNYSNVVSTLTIGQITNLSGRATGTNQITWSWDPCTGVSWYNIYDGNGVFLSSSSVNNFTQTGLGINAPSVIKVQGIKDTTAGLIYGITAASAEVYTLAAPPGPVMNPLAGITDSAMNANWTPNGNPSYTQYVIVISEDNFATVLSTEATLNTSYEITGLDPNRIYCARVYASNNAGIITDFLSLGCKYTLARPPANVHADDITMQGVELDWDANGNPEDTAYQVVNATDIFSMQFLTYIYFSSNYTKTDADITGLLSATTYYFAVSARNGEGIETALTMSDTPILTLPGPAGAPPGSLSGMSSPIADITIAGILKDGRLAQMYIPAASFPDAEIQIAISSSNLNPCPNGLPVEVAIYSAGNAQPKIPVTVTLAYSLTEAAVITPIASELVLARYNPDSNECLPLETSINQTLRTIQTKLNHFSVFQLMRLLPANSLDGVSIYPNPFRPKRGDGFVTLRRMPAYTVARIYTLSGTKIWEGESNASGVLAWNGTNKNGRMIASGIYLCVVESGSSKKILKIAVER